MMITRGLHEMIHFGKALGSDNLAFFGTAGIADLIATATSRKSRNYMFGFRLGSGESLEEVRATSQELAEGVRTLPSPKCYTALFSRVSPLKMQWTTSSRILTRLMWTLCRPSEVEGLRFD